jgi:hypothetical protein
MSEGIKPRARFHNLGRGYWVLRSRERGHLIQGVGLYLPEAYYEWRYARDILLKRPLDSSPIHL